MTRELCDAHREEIERGSGISSEVWRRAGIRTEESLDTVRHVLRFSPRFRFVDAVPAIEFPFRVPGSSAVVLRRYKTNKPQLLGDKEAKYLSPKKGGFRVYIPPSLLESDEARQSIDPIIIVEGEKKTLSADSFGFPCLGLTGVSCWRREKGSIDLHPDFDFFAWEGRPVFVAFDSDVVTKEDVQREEALLTQAFARRRADVRVVRFPAIEGCEKVGLDDLLVHRGPETLRALLESARPVELARPIIPITTREMEVTEQATAALATHHNVFQRLRRLVHIGRDRKPPRGVSRPDGALSIEPIETPRVREILSDVARWVKIGEDGAEDAHPPAWAVDAVMARPSWPSVRPLHGIVSSPVLRRDGSLLTQRGYDPATGLVLTDDAPTLIDVSDRPTHADAVRAVAELRDLVAEFPFASDAHRSGWYALVLTLLSRTAIDGPCPLFLVDSTTPGSGKGLLVELAGVIAFGCPVTTIPPTTDEDEERKRIFSVALAGERAVSIDNVKGTLGTPALCQVLTEGVIGDRVLGESRVPTVETSTIFAATGNNVVLGEDMQRRVIHVRLEPNIEKPEERTFRLELPHAAYERRARLLSAAFRILRGYYAANRPPQSLPPFGRYEAWTGLVRNALVWAGEPDPAATREGLAAMADTTRNDLADLLEGWRDLAGDGFVTAAEALARLREDEKRPEKERELNRLRGAVLTRGELPSPKSLGRLLLARRGRVVGGRRLVSEPSRTGTLTWSVQGLEGLQGLPNTPAGEGSETRYTDRDPKQGWRNPAKTANPAAGSQRLAVNDAEETRL